LFLTSPTLSSSTSSGLKGITFAFVAFLFSCQGTDYFRSRRIDAEYEPFFPLRPHRRSRVGIMYNLAQPLVISTAYGPARLYAAACFRHAPGSSSNFQDCRFISKSAPCSLSGSPRVPRGTCDNRITPQTFLRFQLSALSSQLKTSVVEDRQKSELASLVRDVSK